MSARDRDQELDRQLRSVQSGESEVVVCPWCGVFLSVGEDPCCDDFADAVDRRGRDQMTQIVIAHQDVMAGRSTVIKCPYCEKHNYKRDNSHPADWKRPNVSPFCCDLFQAAVNAIITGQAMKAEAKQREEKMYRIQDAMAEAERD